MALRVVVCYTGGVGSEVVRHVVRNPDFELVGVLVHHEEKDGKDVGELVGIPPVGVTTTRDVDALVALGADAMAWHSVGWEPPVIAKFLRGGTSVYSSVGGWFLPSEPEYEELQAAAEEGGAALIAGGNIPGLISDVLPLFASGYSAGVRVINAWQSDYVPHYPSATQLQQGLGFGVPVDPSGELSGTDQAWLWGIGQSAQIVARGLGIPCSEVRLTNKEYALAPEDMVLQPSGLKIAEGTPAGVRWTFSAFSGDDEFYRLINEQTARLDCGEGWRTSEKEPNWRVLIEGSPSITCEFSAVHSDEGPDPVAALNAARAVNFLPRIAAAAPGWRTVLDVPAPVGTR
jgi:hypothetical protein